MQWLETRLRDIEILKYSNIIRIILHRIRGLILFRAK